MKTQTRQLFSLIALISILSLTGCNIPSTNGVLPTVDSQAVQGTVAAIQTQSVQTAYQQLTAAALLTPAATNTPQPTNTLAASATPTDTQVPPTSTNTPIVNTSTPAPTLTRVVIYIAPTSTATQGPYQCSITYLNPKYNLKVSQNVDFDLNVTLKNVGTKAWDQNDVDFRYLSGSKFQKRVDAIDLPETVDPGDSITLVIDMLAKTDKGYQSASWGLSRSGTTFCWVPVHINVQ